jgi:hypothetical protein
MRARFTGKVMMMKSVVVVAFLVALSAAPAFSGEIFGTLSEGTKPVDAGVKVEISIAGKSYAGETDKFGSFRLIVKEKGKCTLTVRYKDQSPSFQLVSYDKAARYDLVLEATDGKYSLRRK